MHFDVVPIKCQITHVYESIAIVFFYHLSLLDVIVMHGIIEYIFLQGYSINKQ